MRVLRNVTVEEAIALSILPERPAFAGLLLHDPTQDRTDLRPDRRFLGHHNRPSRTTPAPNVIRAIATIASRRSVIENVAYAARSSPPYQFV
jgi:hypothetical protein